MTKQWTVRGHFRHLKDGRKIRVKPYQIKIHPDGRRETIPLPENDK